MTTLDVVIDTADGPQAAGQAHLTRVRGRVSSTFLYSPDYLVGDGMSIDPALPLVSGAQHQAGLVRAFADSAPDRWGRNLLEKAERVRAAEEGRAPRRLDDVDFLLGVSDDTRQGALRFRRPGDTLFLGPASRVPHLVSLPALLRASDQVAADEDPARAVKQLLDTGTTGLGGARPKASVRLEDGALAMAKFPHGSDAWDVMAWEATALDLLEAAGIAVPRRRLTRVGERSVLILRRFDRTGEDRRIGYISAMTALGASDGEHRDYADIAESLRDLSLSPSEDRRQLFERAAANVALGNTDDHLRNHGLLAERGFWSLSPAFDVNPQPDPDRARSTSIMGQDTLPAEAEALPALAEECGLTPAQTRASLSRILSAMSNWQDAARKRSIHEREVSLMAEGIAPRLAAVANASPPDRC